MTIGILKAVKKTKQKILDFYSWQTDGEPAKERYTRQIKEIDKAIEILNKNRT